MHRFGSVQNLHGAADAVDGVVMIDWLKIARRLFLGAPAGTGAARSCRRQIDRHGDARLGFSRLIDLPRDEPGLAVTSPDALAADDGAVEAELRLDAWICKDRRVVRLVRVD